MTDDKANERSELWASEMDASDAKNEQDTEEPTDDKNAWDTQSIRDDWHPNSVRLPDYLQRRWNSEHKRLDFKLSQRDLNIDYSKDRYFKPLVIALGLRELRDMDMEEVETALEDLEENRVVE